VLDSYALSPTIPAGSNPQPHPLLMSSMWVTLLLVLFNYQVILRGISTKSQFTMGIIPCCLDQLCILFPAKKEKERPVLGFCSWVTDWVTTPSEISNSNPNKNAICSLLCIRKEYYLKLQCYTQLYMYMTVSLSTGSWRVRKTI